MANLHATAAVTQGPVWRRNRRAVGGRTACVAAAAAAVVTLLGGGRAYAGNDAWSTAPTDANFADANWIIGSTTGAASPLGTISSGDALYFDGSTITTLNENETALFNIGGLTFNADAAAYNISGNAFTLSGGITNSGANVALINDAITLSATQTITTTSGGGNVSLGGAISGTGYGLTFAGTGTTTLSSNASSYTGNITINGGTVFANSGETTLTNTVTTPNTGALGAPNTAHTVTVNSGGTLNFSASNVFGSNSNINIATTLVINAGGTITNSNNTFSTLGPITLNGGTLTDTDTAGTQAWYFRQGVTVGGTSASTISGTGIIDLVSTPTNFNVGVTGSAGPDLTVSATLAPSATGGAGGLVKTGLGTMLLSGSNTYTGPTGVYLGTLNVTGTIGPTSSVNLNASSGTASVLNTSGTVALTGGVTTSVGSIAGDTGVLNITAGTFGGGTSPIDAGTAGFGTINVSGGVVTPGQYLVSGISAATAQGIWNIYGNGVVKVTSGNGGTLGANSGASGVLNVYGSGSFNTSASTIGLYVGETGTGVLNVFGSGTVYLGTSGNGLDLGVTSSATNVGFVNLGAVGAGGGLINTNVVQKPGALATGILNFHGGTLQASVANTAFMTGLTDAYVYGEGGTIDNNGVAITIAQPLLSPAAGSGANSAPTITAGGAGYVTAPFVTVTGTGGTGATAIATVSGGQVTGITITNPGTGYTGPLSFTLAGGGYATAATVSTVTQTADTSGGLTFVGSGTTTLSGASTYTGATAVNAGKLLVNGSLAAGSSVTVAGGASLGGGVGAAAGTINGPVTVSASGFLIPGGAGTVGTFNLPGGATLAGGSSINLDLNGSSGTVGGATNDLINFGSLTLNGTVSVTPTFIGAQNGTTTYEFGTYTGTIGGTGGFIYASRAYSVSTAANQLTLAPTGQTVANLTWEGYNSAVWDILGTKNWNNNGNSQQDYFYQGDAVTFDDTVGVPTTVSISGVVLPGALTVSSTSAGNNFTFTGTGGIGGAVVLNKTASSTLTLGTSNSYTGGTNLSAGQININTATALGTGPLAFNGSSTIDNTSGAPITLSTNNAQAWNSSFTFGGTNNLNLGTGAVTLGTSPTITTNGSATLTVGGVIGNASGGAYGLTKAGAGTLTLTGNTTYTGPTVVNAGTLTLAAANTTISIGKTSSVTINGGTISIVGDNNFLGTASTVVTTINPGGALTINVAANTAHLGPVTLAGGTLASTGTPTGDGLTYGSFNLDQGLTAGGVTATSVVSAADVALTQTGGTVFNVASGSTSGIDLDVTGNLYHSAALADTGLVKTGAGVLRLDSSNSYTGATNVSAGTLVLANTNAILSSVLTPTATVTFASTVGGSFTIGGLSGAGTLNLADSASNPVALTIGNNATAVAYAGTLTGAGSLIKIGTASQILTGSSSYAGTTNISAGTLQIGNQTTTGSLPASSAILDSGTFLVARTNTATQGVDFGTITGTGAVTLASYDSTVVMTASNGYSGTTSIGYGANYAGTNVLATATNALGTGTIILDAQGNYATSELELSNNSSGSITLPNAITLPARTVSTNTEIENLSGNNTLSGVISPTTGGSGYGITSDAGTLTLSNATSIVGIASTKTVNFQGAGNGVVAGIISGTGLSVAKNGAGTWALNGVNTYTAGTTITAGTLQANGATTALGTGTTNVSGGVLAGTGTTGGPVVVNANGTITGGTGAALGNAAGTLTTGNQTWNASGAYVAKYDGIGADQLVMSGLTANSGFIVNFQEATVGATPGGTYVLAVDQGSSTAGAFNLSALTLEVNGSTSLPSSYSFQDVASGGYDDLDMVISSTPEPTSLLLAGLAAAPLALGRRRRARTA
jgi:fibronectin-binding autotransporter adhesin